MATSASATAPNTIVLIHGFWVTPRSWEHWKTYYEAKGYTVLTPAYPGFEVEVEALRADPTPIEQLEVPEIVDMLENLIGKQIQIEAQGGDPGEPKLSKITLDGVAAPVATGTFTVESLSGKIHGSDGDRTVHGRIELHLRRGDGEHILRGSFGAHAVTWG